MFGRLQPTRSSQKAPLIHGDSVTASSTPAVPAISSSSSSAAATISSGDTSSSLSFVQTTATGSDLRPSPSRRTRAKHPLASRRSPGTTHPTARAESRTIQQSASTSTSSSTRILPPLPLLPPYPSPSSSLPFPGPSAFPPLPTPYRYPYPSAAHTSSDPALHALENYRRPPSQPLLPQEPLVMDSARRPSPVPELGGGNAAAGPSRVRRFWDVGTGEGNGDNAREGYIGTSRPSYATVTLRYTPYPQPAAPSSAASRRSSPSPGLPPTATGTERTSQSSSSSSSRAASALPPPAPPSRPEPARRRRKPHPLENLRLDREYPVQSLEEWEEQALRAVRLPLVQTGAVPCQVYRSPPAEIPAGPSSSSTARYPSTVALPTPLSALNSSDSHRRPSARLPDTPLSSSPLPSRPPRPPSPPPATDLTPTRGTRAVRGIDRRPRATPQSSIWASAASAIVPQDADGKRIHPPPGGVAPPPMAKLRRGTSAESLAVDGTDAARRSRSPPLHADLVRRDAAMMGEVERGAEKATTAEGQGRVGDSATAPPTRDHSVPLVGNPRLPSTHQPRKRLRSPLSTVPLRSSSSANPFAPPPSPNGRPSSFSSTYPPFPPPSLPGADEPAPKRRISTRRSNASRPSRPSSHSLSDSISTVGFTGSDLSPLTASGTGTGTGADGDTEMLSSPHLPSHIADPNRPFTSTFAFTAPTSSLFSPAATSSVVAQMSGAVRGLPLSISGGNKAEKEGARKEGRRDELRRINQETSELNRSLQWQVLQYKKQVAALTGQSTSEEDLPGPNTLILPQVPRTKEDEAELLASIDSAVIAGPGHLPGVAERSSRCDGAAGCGAIRDGEGEQGGEKGGKVGAKRWEREVLGRDWSRRAGGGGGVGGGVGGGESQLAVVEYGVTEGQVESLEVVEETVQPSQGH